MRRLHFITHGITPTMEFPGSNIFFFVLAVGEYANHFSVSVGLRDRAFLSGFITLESCGLDFGWIRPEL